MNIWQTIRKDATQSYRGLDSSQPAADLLHLQGLGFLFLTRDEA